MSTKGLTQTNSGRALALAQRCGCHAPDYHCNSKRVLVKNWLNEYKGRTAVQSDAEHNTTIISIGGAGVLFDNIEFDLQANQLLLAAKN